MAFSSIAVMLMVVYFALGIVAVGGKIDPAMSASDSFSEANKRYYEMDYDGAISYYQHAILLDSENADYYCNYASVLYDLTRIDESESNYLTALQLDGRHTSSLFNSALLLQDRRKSKEAAMLYMRLLAIETQNGDAYANLVSYTKQIYTTDKITVFKKGVVFV